MRLVLCCCLSIALYILSFAFIINRPLSLGTLNLEIAQKASRLAALPSPKLVILAGSNGPYSHACAVIGPMLNLPCENAGIAVGIGLDELFATYAPMLHAGDIIYMPMETEQYVITEAQNNAAVDGAILLHSNRALLKKLPPGRILGAAFSSSFPDFLEALGEMPLGYFHIISPVETLATEYNEDGDRIGASLATVDVQILRNATYSEPNPEEIRDGYGTQLISAFVADETKHGLLVIGGLPTEFRTVPLPPETITAIALVYTANGGRFVTLPNLSRYPIVDFYDSENHLSQPCQYLHSIAIAGLLERSLRYSQRQPSQAVLNLAKTCPVD